MVDILGFGFFLRETDLLDVFFAPILGEVSFDLGKIDRRLFLDERVLSFTLKVSALL